MLCLLPYGFPTCSIACSVFPTGCQLSLLELEKQSQKSLSDFQLLKSLNTISRARLRVTLLEILRREGCLNSMEVCRIVNGFEKNDFRDCYPRGDFRFVTRPERCEYKTRGCNYWSLTIYQELRKLERKNLIKSKKARTYDGGNNQSFKHTDIFRFWFILTDEFDKRVTSQTLISYIKSSNIVVTLRVIIKS